MKTKKLLAVMLSFVMALTMIFGSASLTAFASLADGNTVTVKFVMGGGTLSESGLTADGSDYTTTFTENSEANATVSLPTPTAPADKVFVGWSTSADGNYLGGMSVRPAGLIALDNNGSYSFTAVYADCAITYNANGGVFADSLGTAYFYNGDKTQVVYGADNITALLDDNALATKKEGYSALSGWSTEANGSTTTLSELNLSTEKRTATLHAIWGSPTTTGTITYLTENGTDTIAVGDAPTVINVETGTITPVPETIPTGKTFTGWNVYTKAVWDTAEAADPKTELANRTAAATGATSIDTTTADYKSGIVLVATWGTASYEITYKSAEGNTLTATPNSYSYSDDAQDITLPNTQTAVSGDGKTVKWSDGTNTFAGGATYTIAAGKTGALVFTETEEGLTYTIKYNYAKPSGYAWDVDEEDLAEFEATLDKAADGTTITDTATDEIGLSDLSSGTVYNITRADEAGNLTIKKDASVKRLQKWIVTGDGDKTAVTTVDASKLETGVTTFSLTAEWEDVYTISYDLGDGDWASGTAAATHPTTFATSDEEVTLPTPERTGYTFKGWFVYDDDKVTETEVKKLNSTTVTGNLQLTAVWTENQFTVTLEGLSGITDDSLATITAENGLKFVKGTNTDGAFSGTVTRETKYTEAITLPSPAKDGYNFTGWKLNNTGEASANVQIKEIASALSYTAVFTPKSYTITYKDGENVLTADDYKDKTYTAGTTSITLPAGPAKDGYEFKGWKLNGSGTDIAAGSYDVTTGNLVFVAHYELAEYKITYNLNGGSLGTSADGSAINNPTAYTIDTETFTLNNPTKADYVFTGWTYTGQTTPTKTVTITKGSKTGALEFTANYTEKYTIKYDLSTAVTAGSTLALSGAPAWFDAGTGVGTVDVSKDDSSLDSSGKYAVLTATSTNSEGIVSTLTAWTVTNSLSVADGKIDVSGVAAGTTITLTPTADSWKATYTVSYELDGGTNGAGNPTSFVTGMGTTTNLTAATKEGYTFVQWYKLVGDVKTPVTQLTDTEFGGGNLTLYAEFTINEYTISLAGLSGVTDDSKTALGTGAGNAGFTLDESAGTATLANQTIESTVTIPEIAKDGFRFKGWSNNGGSTVGEKTITLATGSIKANATYTAVFEEEHTLTLAGLLGISNSDAFIRDYSQDASDGDKVTRKVTATDSFKLPTPQKSGKTFKGWKKDGEDTTSTDVTISGMSTNTTYTAIWLTDITLTISFAPAVLDATTVQALTADGYTVDNAKGEAVKTFTNETANFTLPASLAADGYTFGGYYGDTIAEDSAVTDGTTITITPVAATNTSYNVKWTGAEYEVTFDANGGTTSTVSFNVTMGRVYGPLPTPTRSGYTFDGWYTGKTDGDKVTAETLVATASNHTLYAHWTANTPSGTYTPTGSTTPSTSTTPTTPTTETKTETTTNETTGAVTETTTSTSSDGTKTVSETTTQTDGTKTESVTTTKTDTATGATTETAKETTTDASGNVTSTTETTTVTEANGDTKSTTVETDANGAKTTTETSVTTDAETGAKTETKEVANADGSGEVSETVTETTGASTSSTVTTDSTGAATEVSTTTVTANGKTTEAEYDVTKGTNVTLEDIDTTTNKITVPATVKAADGKTYKVTEIAKNAAKGNKTAKQVTVGANVKKIGASAFANCTKVTKATIGKNVTSIAKNTFKGDSKLKTITLQGAKVTSVGKNAFSGIAKNATITIKGSAKQVKKVTNLIKKSGIAKTVTIKRAK